MKVMKVSLVLGAFAVFSLAAVAFAEEGAPTPAETTDAPAALADENFEELSRILEAGEPARRIEAAQAIARHGEQAVPRLLESLAGDPVAEVRGWAARSLWEIGTEEARNAVREGADNDPDERVRGLCARLTGANPPAPAPAAPSATPPGAPPAPRAPPYPAGTYAAPVAAYPAYAVQPYQRRRVNVGRVLTVVGWAAAGGLYAASAVSAAILVADDVEQSWWLFVPIIGPAVYGTQLFVHSEEWWIFEPVAVILGLICWVDTLAQIAGAGLAIAGHVRSRRDRASTPEQPASRRGVHLSLAFMGPGGPGMTLTGRFH